MRRILIPFLIVVLTSVACQPGSQQVTTRPTIVPAIAAQSSATRAPVPTADAALPLVSVTAPALSTPGAQARPTSQPRQQFDGSHAFNEYLLAQMKIGPRVAGTAADRATGDYISSQLTLSQWNVVTQEFSYRNIGVRNIVGKAGQGRGPMIILGAHYDTRKLADQDKTRPNQPVPGADDGASGVAVLLEIARILDTSKIKNEVWLVFFDAEDNGDIPGCEVTGPPCDNQPFPWSVGATYTAEHLDTTPEAVVVVDMVCYKDQKIYYEQNSDKELQQTLWGIAANLGYSAYFIPEFKWSMEDDHTPFLNKKMRAVDIIDFDYPFWHTTEDTTDKCSPASLEHVGRVLQQWLENK